LAFPLPTRRKKTMNLQKIVKNIYSIYRKKSQITNKPIKIIIIMKLFLIPAILANVVSVGYVVGNRFI
jgi:hypothetical protein